MNRKTEKYWRNDDPWELCGLGKDCKRGCVNNGEWCNVALMIRKLAKYEDTGLQPEEIENLISIVEKTLP